MPTPIEMTHSPVLEYSTARRPSVAQFSDLLVRSTLAKRRPVSDEPRLCGMVSGATFFATAWVGDSLVGVARVLTDFVYCAYVSDLAVDTCQQGQGVGTELLRQVQSRLHPDAKLILLAAPSAEAYYPKIGMTPHPSAWVAGAKPPLARQGEESNADAQTRKSEAAEK